MGLCPLSVHINMCDSSKETRDREAGDARLEARPPAKSPFTASYFVVSPSNNSSVCNQCNPSLSSSPGHAEMLPCRPCQSFYPQSKAPAGSGFL